MESGSILSIMDYTLKHHAAMISLFSFKNADKFLGEFVIFADFPTDPGNRQQDADNLIPRVARQDDTPVEIVRKGKERPGRLVVQDHLHHRNRR